MPTNIIRKPVIDTEPDVAVGIKLPLDRSDGGLFDLSYSTREQAISNLKNLLLTNMGERIMQPTFGTTIQEYLFQQQIDVEFDRIRTAIKSAVYYWLPYIIVDECVVSPYNPSGISKGEEYGVLVYLLVRPTESGANVPITLLYTTSTVTVVGEQRVGGDSAPLSTGPFRSV